jgi:hypothetical protein
MKITRTRIVAFCLFTFLACTAEDCAQNEPPAAARSASGVRAAEVEVIPGADGLTTEQRNIASRVTEDNKPGAIKHLYVISPYSGQVIIYSTVKGKVTSSTKRLHPSTVAALQGQYIGTEHNGIPVNLGGYTRRTAEVLGDDGSYGPSNDYIFWWDVRGIYHQHFMTGGQIVHISDQPLTVKSVIINMETQAAEK